VLIGQVIYDVFDGHRKVGRGYPLWVIVKERNMHRRTSVLKAQILYALFLILAIEIVPDKLHDRIPGYGSTQHICINH